MSLIGFRDIKQLSLHCPFSVPQVWNKQTRREVCRATGILQRTLFFLWKSILMTLTSAPYLKNIFNCSLPGKMKDATVSFTFSRSRQTLLGFFKVCSELPQYSSLQGTHWMHLTGQKSICIHHPRRFHSRTLACEQGIYFTDEQHSVY